jgi:leader peptidase (prepilin peptidase)/N-methyltransferase
VPIASWLVQRGRCRNSQARNGCQPLVVELAADSVAVWAGLLAEGSILWLSCLLGWTLLALAAIDLSHYLLPDFLTLPLIPIGILAAWIIDPAAVADSLTGAASGGLFVVAIRYAYRLLRGREGIGLGDAKLLAAAGAWVSWSGLPSVLLIAALSGLLFAVIRSAFGRRLAGTDAVPFGPFLAFGTWIVWLYGPLVM